MQEEKKTFVTITQQMLDGDLTIDEAAEELTKLTPAEEIYDYDGVSYEGEQRNTISAMFALAIDSNAMKVDRQKTQHINELLDTAIAKKHEKKTFVTIAQQMLNGEITMEQAAKEMMQITPAEPKYDYDGMYYEGEEDNTVSSMMLLGMDKDTGEIDPEIKQRINKLIDTVIAKEKEMK